MLVRLSILIFLLPFWITGQHLLVAESAQKMVLIPSSDIGDDWRQNITYNDSNWNVVSGMPGGIGYELNSGYENYISLNTVNEMSNVATNPNNSCYIRIPFSVTKDDTAGLLHLQLNIRYDDGFVAYLNGNKVAEAQAPDPLQWNSSATSNQVEGGEPVPKLLDAAIRDLVIGQNLLAIHGLNYSTNSSDFLITAELQTEKSAEKFTSSNLPLVFITVPDSSEIVHEPKIMAHMGIVYNGLESRNSINDPFNEYDGYIGIEYRGNASFRVSDKKPYTIETRNEDESNNNVKLLGLPKENDFVLRAGYIDKTLMRDALAYYLYRSMGRWTPRTRHVELFLNGEYQGVYILEEKIKPDKNRLDIAKMDASDTTGDALTGGYIWCTNHRWEGSDDAHNDLLFDSLEADGNERFLRYPKPNDATPEQFTYISELEQQFCDLMAGPNYNDPSSGYETYIDVPSFIDEIIIQELTSNSDAYSYSGYFHKDRGKKISAGPEWDFDQALCNSTHHDGARTDQWAILIPDDGRPPFWDRLFTDNDFLAQLKTRWNAVRKNALSDENIVTYIDSIAGNLSEAQEHNFAKWPILGVPIWRSVPGAEERDTYQKEVDFMKDWLLTHVEWMDAQFVIDTSIENTGYPPLQSFTLEQNFPNPFNPETVIRYTIKTNDRSSQRIQLKIFDITGKEVKTLFSGKQTSGSYKITFDASNMASGVYLYRIMAGDQAKTRKMILLR